MGPTRLRTMPTSQVYRHTRDPIYSGVIIILLSQSWLLASKIEDANSALLVDGHVDAVGRFFTPD